MALSQSIAEGSPLYACPLCGVAVYLVSRKEERRFFFRHDLEDGRCPARTRGEMSEQEINARKYNGAKERQAHIRMKEIIAESLHCDPRFSEVRIEAVLKGQDRAEWRRKQQGTGNNRGQETTGDRKQQGTDHGFRDGKPGLALTPLMHSSNIPESKT